MATNLGKRKRRTVESRKSQDERSLSPEIDAQEIFRRHFEAQFQPLAVVPKAAKPVEDASEDESSEESEWEGISEPAEGSVEVIEHSDAQSRMAAMSKGELKAFMACCLPVPAVNGVY